MSVRMSEHEVDEVAFLTGSTQQPLLLYAMR